VNTSNKKLLKIKIAGVDLSLPLLLLPSLVGDDEPVAYALVSAGALLCSIYSVG